MKNDNKSTDDTNDETSAQNIDDASDTKDHTNEQNLDETEPTEVASQVPQPRSAIIMVLRAHLQPHPKNRQIFRPASPEKKAELREDMSQHGQINALVITGDNCASGPNVILAGEERYEGSGELGWTHLNCRVIDNLTANQEILVMVAHNRADLKGRGYSHEDRYRMEEAVRGANVRGGRQGQRSDLKPELLGGRLDHQEAEENDTSTNALHKRRKVYGASVSTPELKSAVNNKKIRLNPAGEIIYDVEREFQGRNLDEPSVLLEAQREVNQRLEQHAANKRVGRPKKQDSQKGKGTPTSEQAQTAAASDSSELGSGEGAEQAEGPLTLPTTSAPVIAVSTPASPVERKSLIEVAALLTAEQIDGIIQRQPLEAIAAMSRYAETLSDSAIAAASRPTVNTVALALKGLMTVLLLVQDEILKEALEASETSS